MHFRKTLTLASLCLSSFMASAQVYDAEQAQKDMMIGMQGLKAAKDDPELLAQLMRDMADPEMMAEAAKMMKDPKWQKEMKKFQESPEFKETVKKTQDMLKDPHAAAQAEAKMEHMIKTGQKKHQAGVQSAMEQAMAGMNDPEMLKQMQQMVKDPNFKKQFEAMAKNPEFAEYMKAAQEMMTDPAKKAQFEKLKAALLSKMPQSYFNLQLEDESRLERSSVKREKSAVAWLPSVLAGGQQQQRGPRLLIASVVLTLFTVLLASNIRTFSDAVEASRLVTIANNNEANVATTEAVVIPPPFQCEPFLTDVRAGTKKLGVQPNMGNTTITVQMQKPFQLSLHTPKYDPIRSIMFTAFRYYEKALDKAYERVLSVSPVGSQILDVGGNIGYHAILSASLGNFVIDSFEPKLENVLRFCESIELNKWNNPTSTAADHQPRVNINNFGISNKDETLVFAESNSNPGAGKLLSKGENPGRKKTYEITVRTLDSFAESKGWFDTKPNIAVLKIDIERHEAPAILGAKRLLQTGLVRNIFVETSREGLSNVQSDDSSAFQLLLDSGYRLYQHGSWKGPGKPSPWASDKDLAKNVLEHLKKGKAPYMNVWWTNDPSFAVQS